MDHLTPTNVVLGLLVLDMLLRVLRSVAPKTATTTDDQVVAGIDQAVSWAHAAAPHIWAVVEGLAAQGALPKAQKAAQFALLLRAEYAKQAGKVLPQAAEAAAQLAAQGLSASEKLARAVPAAAAAVPQAAPGSQ